MKHFSLEYLEQLQAEHKLVSAALKNLENNPRKYFKSNYARSFDLAINDLASQKIMLESKIDILIDFLN